MSVFKLHSGFTHVTVTQVVMQLPIPMSNGPDDRDCMPLGSLGSVCVPVALRRKSSGLADRPNNPILFLDASNKASTLKQSEYKVMSWFLGGKGRGRRKLQNVDFHSLYSPALYGVFTVTTKEDVLSLASMMREKMQIFCRRNCRACEMLTNIGKWY
jgi:hypothetical protein